VFSSGTESAEGLTTGRLDFLPRNMPITKLSSSKINRFG
jgi:hypothetical protein